MNKQLSAKQIDGKDHINIYSNAKTFLGRTLSNFTYRRFEHPELGSFCGMEGLYYYLATGKIHEPLRRLSGLSAKKVGSKLPRVEMDKEEFTRLLRMGIRASFNDNPILHTHILDQIVINKGELLPFVHYYMYGDKIITPEGNEWLVEEWEAIRNEVVQIANGAIQVINGKRFVNTLYMNN